MYVVMPKGFEVRFVYYLGAKVKYVTSNGHASGSDYSIKDRPDYFTRVRRVCKAVAKFDKMDKDKKTIKAAKNAYYACLLEVIKVCDNIAVSRNNK
jgi:hypothetical protein